MADRRRYPRVQAEVIWRPAGVGVLHDRRNTQDISLGGIRVYSDESFDVGTRVDLDVMLPNQDSVRCWAVVVWVTGLKPGSAAKFDVGLRFEDMAPSDVQRLAAVLVPAR